MDLHPRFSRVVRIAVRPDLISLVRDPHFQGLTSVHALVRVNDYLPGQFPSSINPRATNPLRGNGRVAADMDRSLAAHPSLFHLFHRGLLVLARKATYDKQSGQLSLLLDSETDGLADGCVTDRILANLRGGMNPAAWQESPAAQKLNEAYVRLEILAGELPHDMRLRLVEARHASEAGREFSLKDMPAYAWLRELLENSDLKGKIRYQEGDNKPFDVRLALSLLTLFHPQWSVEAKEPVLAYAAKGMILDLYGRPEWKEGFQRLSPVAVDILRLYEYVSGEFQKGLQEEDLPRDGMEEKERSFKELPLTGRRVEFQLPDGWLFPILASLRVLLAWPRSAKEPVAWKVDPFQFFYGYGPSLTSLVLAWGRDLGKSPHAAGKSPALWTSLRNQVELALIRVESSASRACGV